MRYGPVTSTEAARLAALDEYGILHTPREPAYDEITQLVARLFETPIALVSLVGRDSQWFKSSVGVDASETSIERSLCKYAISRSNNETVFMIQDAMTHPFFKDHPAVAGAPFIRMYAGMPLITRDGYAIGTLCVADTKPRAFSRNQLDTLKTLSHNVMSLIEQRKADESLRRIEERSRLVIDTAAEAVATTDERHTVTSWNRQAEITFGWMASEVIGKGIFPFILPGGEASDFDHQTMASLTAEGNDRHSLCFERELGRRDGSRFPGELVISSTKTGEGWMFACFIRDASSRKKAETERHQGEMRDVVIFTVARLAESRDPETGAHVERVQEYCRALTEQLAKHGPYRDQIDDEFIQLMYTTSPLHDIGKVGIPDDVLLKPGRLNEREFEIMKTHTTIGADTLEAAAAKFPDTKFLKMARNIAATHHERYDGLGYPKGLAGNDIPLCGRITAVADVYDALTTRRVYKDAYAHVVARAIILKESGKQFDPAVVDAFLAIEDNLQAICCRWTPEARARSMPHPQAA